MTGNDESESICYEDPGGNLIKFFNYKGIPLPTFFGDMKTRMINLPSLKGRPDDICVCGYVKSGTNWVWEVINMLLSGKAEHLEQNKMAMMLEATDLEFLDAAPSPRVFNTHLLLPDLPPDIIAQGARIVYLLRNPKDVCVSHFHHNFGAVDVYEYHGNFENYFQLWLNGHVDNGSWFAYVKHWEEQLKLNPHLDVHIIHYEKLKMDFKKEIKELSQFLRVHNSDDFYEEMAQKCNINVMKKFKHNAFSEAERACWRENKPLFFRKGIIGDWKNHFTVSQNETFDDIIEERLRGSSLKFIYEGWH